jgi:hypothetical protein
MEACIVKIEKAIEILESGLITQQERLLMSSPNGDLTIKKNLLRYCKTFKK